MTRMAWAFTTCLATWAVAISAFVHLPTKLIWNASASVPIGLYTVQQPDSVGLTDIAVIDPPEPLAEFMSGRGYLPLGVPLLKQVAGLPGQRICRTDLTITIDGVEMGNALERDRLGRDRAPCLHQRRRE